MLIAFERASPRAGLLAGTRLTYLTQLGQRGSIHTANSEGRKVFRCRFYLWHWLRHWENAMKWPCSSSWLWRHNNTSHDFWWGDLWSRSSIRNTIARQKLFILFLNIIFSSCISHLFVQVVIAAAFLYDSIKRTEKTCLCSSTGKTLCAHVSSIMQLQMLDTVGRQDALFPLPPKPASASSKNITSSGYFSFLPLSHHAIFLSLQIRTYRFLLTLPYFSEIPFPRSSFILSLTMMMTLISTLLLWDPFYVYAFLKLTLSNYFSLE